MSDPARVVRAVKEVRTALAGWQEAATEAMSAAREEHRGVSATVQESGASALRVRTRAANLAQDLARLGASVADTRAGLEAAAAVVERRSRIHHELTEHVTQTHAAWSGHVERAEHDHAAAIRALNWARQMESDARRDFEAARAQVGGAQSESEWHERQAALGDAEARYNVAVSRLGEAQAGAEEQRARVARCRRAMGLAQQAVEVLRSTAAHVDSAVQAVQTGRQRLSEVETATNTARAHLVRMSGYADEAVSHAGQADQHLTSASQHLSEAENWYQRGSLLAMDAGDEMGDILQELQRIDAPMGGGSAPAGSSIPGEGGIGVDRGDGRDVVGHFTGRGGYGASKEAEGLEDYATATTRDNVIHEHVRAVLPDGSIRYYDGLSKNQSGTYEGIEVKSGSAQPTRRQRAFDDQVNAGVPATANLRGEKIVIISASLVKVK